MEETTVFGMYEGVEVSGISGTDIDAVQEVVQHFEQEIIAQRADNENNYGLLFYCCGYNGRAQQEYAEYYRETYGVRVFWLCLIQTII